MTSQRKFNLNNIANNMNYLSSLDPRYLHSTRMKQSSSNKQHFMFTDCTVVHFFLRRSVLLGYTEANVGKLPDVVRQ